MHTSQLWGSLDAHFITKFCLSDSSQYQYPRKSIFFYFSPLELLSINKGQNPALLPSPGCCRTIDGGAVRQLPVLGCSACLLLSEGITSTACSRNSSRLIREPHCACLDYPIVPHSGSQSDAPGNGRDVVQVL